MSQLWSLCFEVARMIGTDLIRLSVHELSEVWEVTRLGYWLGYPTVKHGEDAGRKRKRFGPRGHPPPHPPQTPSQNSSQLNTSFRWKSILVHLDCKMSEVGEDQYFYTTLDSVEDVECYQPGGFHPVHLGDCFDNERFRIVYKLSSGGFATVWLACDSQLNEYVALKIHQAQNFERCSELRFLEFLRG
jgi:hypothetical protein